MEIALPGCGVGFEDLRNVPKVLDHVVEAALRNLQRRECEDGVAEASDVEIRPESRDDPALLELVETGLNGSTCDA